MADKTSDRCERAPANGPKSTEKMPPHLQKKLQHLARRPETRMHCKAAPEISKDHEQDSQASDELYRPLKQPITIRIDADVLAWFKSKGGKYQAHINRVLRRYVAEQKSDM